MNSRPLFFMACIATGLAGGSWWINENSQTTPAVSNSALPNLSGQSEPNTNSAPVFDSQARIGNETETVATVPANPDVSERSESTLQAQPVQSQSDSDQSQSTLTHAQPQLNVANSAAQPPVLSYHEGIMKVAPAVVSLYASARETASETGRESSSAGAARVNTSQGSGVLVDSNGIVLTNLHLIEGLDAITVVLSNGRNYAATLLGGDRETDLAVVKIPASNLPFVKLGEAPPLRVGDVVLAIGNPFGVGQTVTQGIVSATRRRIAGGSVWQNFVQIDAAINPGNSGGALINPHGQLVGVNTAVFRGDSGAVGIGFSIPADLLVQVVPQIIENGTVARGWLGIGVDDLSMFPELGMSGISGSVITSVRADSPASRGGLRQRDVVTHLGEQPISDATHLLLAVSALPPGATVKLTVLRRKPSNTTADSGNSNSHERIDLKMRLGTRPNLGGLTTQ